MKPGTRYALAVVALLLMLVAAIGTSLVLADMAQGASNRQWCSALDLLTSHPVPAPSDPKANPSRVEAYELYADFVGIEKRFGC